MGLVFLDGVPLRAVPLFVPTMKNGDVTSAICPVEGCRQRLIYQEEGPVRMEGGLPITVPMERHFYRCPDHGLFRFRGQYFSAVPE